MIKQQFKWVLFTLWCGLPSLGLAKAVAAEFQMALIADCQYADKNDRGELHYRSCPGKLQQALTQLNELPLKGVIHLGDLIEEDVQSFHHLQPILATSRHPVRHVLGNHEFSIAEQEKSKVTQLLQMPARYYSFDQQNWRFIVLDGTDVSHYGWPQSSRQHQQNLEWIAQKYTDGATWNGAMGPQQLAWLATQLNQADQEGKKVVLLNHFPVYPMDPHVLWNQQEVLSLIRQHPSVKAWFNGHNHKGDYGQLDGIHFVTLHAMLNTAETAFSVLTFTDDQIILKGHGRQPDLRLPIR